AQVAHKEHLPGAFPNFKDFVENNTHYGGTILVNSKGAEWRDIPLKDMRNPPLDKVGDRFRASNTYASKHGFVGAFPNFMHADHGCGIVCGTVLINREGGIWRDVPLEELGNPSLSDIKARFRATHDYAVQHGFVSG